MSRQEEAPVKDGEFDMTRVATTGALLFLLSVSAAAHAAGPQSADIQSAAKKLCAAKLDHDNFPYSTMDECVDDQSGKLLRAQKGSLTTPQSAAGKRASNPS